MEQYILKSALIAEIEKKISSCFLPTEYTAGRKYGLGEALKIIDTQEVKEVDLDVMQRMEECPYRQVGCTMYEGKILECKGACSWVADYPKLKELKVQKGE